MKKKINRRDFLKVMGVVGMTASLAACGDSGSSSAAASSTAGGDDGVITISYWTTDRHDQAYLTPLIEEYNKTNSDNIYIDYQVYADNYSQMLDLAFSTDTAPDVFKLSGTDPLEVQVDEKKMLLDLSPYMTEEYKARFWDGAFVQGINSWGDGIYSLPFTASACRLFYNQDLLDRVGISAPPKTLKELVDDATLVTKQLSGEGIYGIAGNYKSAMSAVMRSIDPVVQVSGGTCYGFDFKNGKYDFSSYREVLQLFREMYSTGVAFPGSESLDIDPLRTQFAAGNIAFYFSLSHAEPGVYQSQFPTDINWNCCQIPSLSGNTDGVLNVWFGGSDKAINASTKHPDEAWKVMEFLHSDEVMGPYYTAGLGTVMIKSAVEGAEPPASIETMPDLAIGANDQNWPIRPAISIEGEDYSTVAVQCIFGLKDIDQAISELNDRYNNAYDKSVADGAKRIVYPNFTAKNQDTSV